MLLVFVYWIICWLELCLPIVADHNGRMYLVHQTGQPMLGQKLLPAPTTHCSLPLSMLTPLSCAAAASPFTGLCPMSLLLTMLTWLHSVVSSWWSRMTQHLRHLAVADSALHRCAPSRRTWRTGCSMSERGAVVCLTDCQCLLTGLDRTGACMPEHVCVSQHSAHLADRGPIM